MKDVEGRAYWNQVSQDWQLLSVPFKGNKGEPSSQSSWKGWECTLRRKNPCCLVGPCCEYMQPQCINMVWRFEFGGFKISISSVHRPFFDRTRWGNLEWNLDFFYLLLNRIVMEIQNAVGYRGDNQFLDPTYFRTHRKCLQDSIEDTRF